LRRGEEVVVYVEEMRAKRGEVVEEVECQVEASGISPACTRKIVWMSLVLRLVGEERPNRIGRRAI
jgi:hypothetical protein